MTKADNKQKKLMILGGSRYALPVIEAAHKLGLYVITCDYLPDNYAHRFSDEYCNVSIIDKEATLEAARRLEIDGIVSFACDPGVVTAAYVAEEMGLPNVGPYESVCILQNKGRFRRFLAEHGFTVPAARQYRAGEEPDPSLFHWPVIVKPTDSAGSKGVTRVDRPEDLPAAVAHALDYSHCGEFIVEDFITQKGFSSDTDCFSVNGELRFVTFNNQRFDPDCENPYAPAGFSWPSSMSEEHQEELKNELQRLLRLLNMRTALYNVECREGTDGKAYLMEVSPRGGGNRLAECLRHAAGVDLIEAVVRDAVGLPLNDVSQKPYRGHFAEVILHSEKPGIFEALETDPSIAENIVERDLWVSPGDAVGGFSAANESLGTLILRFDDEEHLAEMMKNVREYVHIRVK
ncbi:MAG: ATP-grasp domain-containing protein [Lachnospiraceae bacterium]|nr:ATP-grasp domain-containing protein [Lachnospiraceae bacterium]